MKDIEKKLNSLVADSNNVSSAVLCDVKARISSDPLPEQEVKQAASRTNFRRTLRATVSACAVIVLCIISVFIAIPLSMRASSPQTDGDSAQDCPSLSEFNEKLIEMPVTDYSKENGLTLLSLNDDCEFYLLTADGMPDIYKSVYERKNDTITIIQTTAYMHVSDLEDEIFISYFRTAHACDSSGNLSIIFNIYENSDSFIAVGSFGDNTVYVKLNFYHDDSTSEEDKNIDLMTDILDNLSKNYDY